MNLLDDIAPSPQTKLTLPVAKVALLAFADHFGMRDLLVKELFFDEAEFSLLRQHPRYSQFEQSLSLANNESPDEILARAEGDAVARLVSLVKKGDDKTAFNAVREVLDRVKGKPVQTNRTINSTVTLDVDVAQLARDRAEAEKRLEGFKSMRAKMLEKANISSGKTIDAILVPEEPQATRLHPSQPNLSLPEL